MTINPPDWYFIYLNPTFEEVQKLAESMWDTCRIIKHEDDIVIASGLGNTHESMLKAYRTHTQNLRAMPEAYILYHRGGIAFFNLEDLGGSRAARAARWERFFCDLHIKMLKDLIRESGYAL